jgi:aspartyl-tRNA(Asn)/glutamyl-tRNA(Gln) amidotransferase subunit A
VWQWIKNRINAAGSQMLGDYASPIAATAVERIQKAGGTIIGKTNLDEFAMGSSTETGMAGPTRHPLDPAYSAGGSSGGSAAAVAADLVPAALGSDTGGSVRQPAAHCGVVGTKLTYGRVSRRGLIAFASSLDHIGTLTKTVDDAAWLSAIIAGHDSRDATSVARDVGDWRGACSGDVEGLCVGVPTEYLDGEEVAEGLEDDVRHRVESAIDHVADAGADCVEVSLPHTKLGVAAYYVIAAAEASSNLARYDGVRFGSREEADPPENGDFDTMVGATRTNGFGREVKRRIMLGTYVMSSGYEGGYYDEARRVRALVRRDFERVFDEVDLLIAPTTPTPPFELGSRLDDPLAMYLSDVFTVPANLAGIPAMNLPAGRSDDGLPVGVQLMAPWFDEATMFRVASAIEGFAGEEV